MTFPEIFALRDAKIKILEEKREYQQKMELRAKKQLDSTRKNTNRRK